MDHFVLPDDELAIVQRYGGLHKKSTHAGCDLMAFGASSMGKIGPTYCQNVKTLDDYYAIIDSGQLPVGSGLSLCPAILLSQSIIQSWLC